MENVQREILRILLERLRSRGLLSEAVCAGAVALAYSGRDTPPLLRRPVYPAAEEEGTGDEPASDTP